jgi:hypothetical protein
VNAQYSSSILECASASDSDCESVTLGGPDVEPDDFEDVPQEQQPLWLTPYIYIHTYMLGPVPI